MGTAKDFVARIFEINGVANCLLVRKDGMVLVRSSDELIRYSSLMVAGREFASEIMKTSGFSHCRYLSFNRKNNQHFYVFFFDKFLLSVEQRSDCDIPDMLKAIFSLIERVSTSKSDENQDGS